MRSKGSTVVASFLQEEISVDKKRRQPELSHGRHYMRGTPKLFLAQTDPVYSNLKRYINGTHSFEQFSNKIPFNDGLGERIQEGVAKTRAERRSGLLFQCSSKFSLIMALSYAWNGSIRWTFELSHRKLSLSTTISHVFPVHSMLQFLLHQGRLTWPLRLLPGHPKWPLRLLLGERNSPLFINLGQSCKTLFWRRGRRPINYSMELKKFVKNLIT